jgi:hypothetical protein
MDLCGRGLARILLAMADGTETRVADAGPEAMEPRAFPGWARDPGAPAPRAVHPAPRATRIAPGHFNVNPTVYPRRYGSRWPR